jgi:hypothetical protein
LHIRIAGTKPKSCDGGILNWTPKLAAAKIVWSTIRAGATHQLVLQEDTHLCVDFGTLLAQAMSVAPRGAIAPFADWATPTAQAIRSAALAGASWTRAADPATPRRIPGPEENAATCRGLPQSHNRSTGTPSIIMVAGRWSISPCSPQPSTGISPVR